MKEYNEFSPELKKYIKDIHGVFHNYYKWALVYFAGTILTGIGISTYIILTY
jgi:hypothetical protein